MRFFFFQGKMSDSNAHALQCSTDSPCSQCAAHQRECLYDQSADKRRKEYLWSTKYRLAMSNLSLRYYHRFVEDLLACLRLGNNDQLEWFVQVIRSTSTNSDLVDRSSYTQIREAMYTILGDYEDAEGSEVTLDTD